MKTCELCMNKTDDVKSPIYGKMLLKVVGKNKVGVNEQEMYVCMNCVKKNT